MTQFPSLSTVRLSLGEIRAADIPSIVQYAGNKKITDNTLNIPYPYQEKDAIFWINMSHQGFQDKTKYIFAIRLKATEELIGGIGLHVEQRFNRAELGYWIAEPHWNKGYVTEAAQAILKFGFEDLELNKIYATHLTENLASGKVMIKNGMILEGELKEHIQKGTEYKNLLQYRLTKGEYERVINFS